MTKEEKINKILEYCEYTKQLETNTGNDVFYLVEIKDTVEIETDQQYAESKRYVCVTHSRIILHSAICKAVLDAEQYSQTHNCLSSVKVYIKTYNPECNSIDVDPIDEYEINFENGIEVQ